MIPPTYHVQVNNYRYITDLLLMIHKYIPYSAYQAKTVNCCQLIQVPLTYCDNYFHAGIASCYFYMVQDMAEHVFKL